MFRTFKKLKSLLLLSTTGCVAFSGICLCKGNETFYRDILMPGLQPLVEAENAHQLFLKLAKWGFIPKIDNKDSQILHSSVCGMHFNNPIGLAGGFDKNAEAVSQLFDLGFGFIEVGSITPLPQSGNDRPRIFRLPEDKAIINRCGFNSKGHEFALEQLEKSKPNLKGVLGVSLGKNKLSESAEDDYVLGVKRFSQVADYLVINISSPNTPGLRNLQEKNKLETLLNKVLEARNSSTGKKPAIFVKMAPDVSEEWKKDIASLVTRKGKEIDGLIISNTTTERSFSLVSPNKTEQGGLSGAPLKTMSTKCISDMYLLTKGRVAIVGVGGVFSGHDAYEKIRAGASLVQIYTALAYEGPPVIRKINRELELLLQMDSFSSLSEAVGADHQKR